MNNEKTAEERYLELLVACESEAEATEKFWDEVAESDFNITTEQVDQIVADARANVSVLDFLKRHPEYYASAANSEKLLKRAEQLAAGEVILLQDLEAAYFALQPELEQRPAPAPAEQPEPTTESDHGIKKIEHSGATLKVDPETRAELSKLSLAELRKRADKDRWDRIKASGRDLSVRQDGQ